MTISIDTKKLQKQIARLTSLLPQAIDDALSEIAEKAANEARTKIAYTPWNAGSGLQAATKAYRNSATEHGVIADKHYASWVEWGNGSPGSKIYPTKASCLHFKTRDGKDVFVKWVRASLPHPFMQSAMVFAQSTTAQDIVARHIESAIQRSK